MILEDSNSKNGSISNSDNSSLILISNISLNNYHDFTDKIKENNLSITTILKEIIDKDITNNKLEILIEELKSFDYKIVINILCKIMEEKEIDLITRIYKSLSYIDFYSILKETYRIQRNGGMVNNRYSDKKKTTGGVFMSLVKQSTSLSKKELKGIFTIDYKTRREKRKFKIIIDKFSDNLSLS